MHVQVNTDRNITGGTELSVKVEAVVKKGLKRFIGQVTRIEVHLSDENSAKKGGGNDMRCLLEARPAGLQSTSVSHHAATIEQAVDGAVDKMKRVLDGIFARRADH
ncbi:MAG TPA: HPF/RaiA family ribosome-associated protein [Candidatus Aminicenantes bacterium]|nr:HPF/RaiA family ribosome-associated protein [Candidatus Aminicenantes bacterium]